MMNVYVRNDVTTLRRRIVYDQYNTRSLLEVLLGSIACSSAAFSPDIGLFRFFEWGNPLQHMVWADIQGIISAEIMIRHEQKPGGCYLSTPPRRSATAGNQQITSKSTLCVSRSDRPWKTASTLGSLEPSEAAPLPMPWWS